MKILSVKLKSVIITALVIIAVALGIFFTAHTLSDAVSAEARMIPIYNVDTPENKVSVTFNCAVGNSDIDSILTTLDKYGVKATFFLLGSWADDYPEEVQKIYDAGHEIGNHSYSHKDMPSMNYEDILLDIQKCNETVRNITGHSPTLFRAPSGSYDNKTISAAENLGMVTIQWDAEPLATTGNGYVLGFLKHENNERSRNSAPSVFICCEDSNTLNLLFFRCGSRDNCIYEALNTDYLQLRVLRSCFHCSYGLYSKCTSAHRLFLNYHT